ncbi:MAG TPA: patatin-like phospholipase family protein [Syntrophales bacterium]|jgi:NTE family protein|nr:patatin-like phospholipase family protein [Syntrophales bacterium]HRT61373.1 patatin-like phospholipase family protein [Syntrophales bacterium]
MIKPPKIGLALGSGSARGLSHIGVIRGLQEANIPIDVVCGSSMGALVGGAFASGKLDVMEQIMRRLSWAEFLQFMELPLPRSGLIDGDKIAQYMRDRLADVNIEDLPIPYGAVATDLASGQEVWLQKGSLINAIRASISMPGMFTPLKRDGLLLADGGLVNPVPVSLCRALGAQIVIGVNPNTDVRIRYELSDGAVPTPEAKTDVSEEAEESDIKMRDLFLAGLTLYVTERLRKGKSALVSHFSGKETEGDHSAIRDHVMGYMTEYINSTMKQGKSLALGRLMKEGGILDPSLLEVVLASINLMADRIAKQRLVGDPPDVMVLPHASHVGPLEFSRADEIIDAGRRAVTLMLPMLKDLIGYVLRV